MTRRDWVLVAVGGVAALLGLVWFLQGLNVIGGSFMTGSRVWLIIGAVLAVFGVYLAGSAVIRGAKVGSSQGKAGGPPKSDS